MEKFSRILPFLLFPLSFIAVILSLKLHLPLDSDAGGSPEVSMVELKGLLKEEFRGSLSSLFPCVGPDEAYRRIERAPEHEVLPRVSFVYIGKEKYALVGEELLKEGDKWGEWTVKTITLSGVILENERGVRKWVGLEE